MKHAACYKQGYPRPRFVRDSFLSLNGEWNFAFDDEKRGEKKGWYAKGVCGKKITVPFACQTEASGIGEEGGHDVVWYSRSFDHVLPVHKRLLIHFEGADYFAKVWLNGKMLGTHKGGYARFTFDMTDYLKKGINLLVVKCEDRRSAEQPRGKQRYVAQNVSCFYTDTTGLWKTVWLEEVNDVYLKSVTSSCEYDRCTCLFEYRVSAYRKGLSLSVECYFRGKKVGCVTQELFAEYGRLRVDMTLFGEVLCMKPWSAGNPSQFFDVRYKLFLGGKIVDEVASYTGLVDYRTKGNCIQVNYLQNTYFRMVLDQGYFPGSGLTPKSDEELLADVLLIKQMGFNGVRKHQKIEDERFYYFCDMVGLYCWLEMPAIFDFTPESVSSLTSEWVEIVRQHAGYLSVMAYVPVNESWGVLQTAENKQMQQLTAGLYGLTKALAPNGLVISNDGWEHTVSDVVTLHNYAQTATELAQAYADMPAFLGGGLVKDGHTRTPFADGWQYGGQPVLISEYGGVSLRSEQGWGYSDVTNSEELYLRIRSLTEAILGLDCQGYCYTQFTDVMQEKNGLLTEERKSKLPVEKIAEINALKRT